MHALPARLLRGVRAPALADCLPYPIWLVPCLNPRPGSQGPRLGLRARASAHSRVAIPI